MKELSGKAAQLSPPAAGTLWSDGFEHDLTVTRFGLPATAEVRRDWKRVAEVRQQLEDNGRSGPT